MSRQDRIQEGQNLAELPHAEKPTSLPPAAPTSAASKQKRLLKPIIFGAIAMLALGGIAYTADQYWTVGRFMVETDDAYVAADITLISSRVQGYVESVGMVENAHVSAGDILVQLDDGDHQIALDTAESRVSTAGLSLLRIDAQVQAARAAVTQG
jgi:membrane fusion protein (multidrug efflux system)